MRNWLIGTGLIIGGALLMPLLIILGFSHRVSAIIGIAVPTCGFAIQIYSAFSMRASFERERRRIQREHEVVMERAEELPPEEAISLLLGSIH